jgi:hypothetical protein
MSVNTDLVEQIQTKINDQFLPAIKAAESNTVKVAGRDIDIPAPDKAQFKQDVMQIKAELITDLNKIGV